MIYHAPVWRRANKKRKLNKAERKKVIQNNTYINGNLLTNSLLQYGNFLSWRNCAVINKTQPFEITPPPSTMTNVNKYANTFKIRTDKSRHAWFAIEPLSILSGGSRNTSHPLVSCTVRWLERKQTENEEEKDNNSIITIEHFIFNGRCHDWSSEKVLSQVFNVNQVALTCESGVL